MKPLAIAFLLMAFLSSASGLRAAPDSGATSAQPDPYAKVAEPPAHSPTFVPDRAEPDPQVAEPSTAAPSSTPSITVAFDPTAARDFAQMRIQAEKGDAAAQFNLGRAYGTGQGVAKDSTEAVKWYRKAAEQGHAKAEFWLGVMYGVGEGVAKDPIEAVKWHRKAAEQGDADGQFCLGGMYRNGDGVAKDPAEAVKWLRKAAVQGHGGAQIWLGDIYSVGEGVAQDPAEAVKWWRKAAAGQGLDRVGDRIIAQVKLDRMYITSQGLPIFLEEPVTYWRKAAERGSADAQFRFGWVFYSGKVEDYSGKSVAKDPTEAVKWFRKAAEQGHADAQYWLGVMYDAGEGVAKDLIEAAKWYRKAAYQGDVLAQFNLGSAYANGKGVLKDEIEALAWWNIAAASGNDEAVKNRDALEFALGRQMSVVAQQRSKEILKEIEAAKARPPDSTAADSSTPKSSGSGAIISAQGIILTAAHVVADATRLTVLTAQGTCRAKILRVDEANDLAILKIEGRAFVPLPIAPSRQVRLGQSVATIGFPNIGFQGFSPKVTRGEISSVNGFADDPRSWQISVPVQPGNSGGPLLDDNGNLIGIVVAKLGLKAAQATGDIPQNVNYAVKSAYALALLEPYLDKNAPEPRQGTKSFEDMVAQAQASVVLVLAY